MSASMYFSGPHDRLRVDADGDTVSVCTRDEYGFSINRVSLRLTSADRDALRAALDKLDTTEADADAMEAAA